MTTITTSNGGKTRDFRGMTFGFLTALRLADRPAGPAYWECSCICGGVAVVRGHRLRSGHTKSCGCFVGVNLRIVRQEP